MEARPDSGRSPAWDPSGPARPPPQPCSEEASGQVATDPCSTSSTPASSSSPDRPSGPGPSFRGESVRHLPKLSVPALVSEFWQVSGQEGKQWLDTPTHKQSTPPFKQTWAKPASATIFAGTQTTLTKRKWNHLFLLWPLELFKWSPSKRKLCLPNFFCNRANQSDVRFHSSTSSSHSLL